MTLQQFKDLDEATQTKTVWKNGVHIATRDDQMYQYLLYQLDGFYVEVWYHVELEILHRLRAFENTDFLEPYLEQIDLQLLLYH